MKWFITFLILAGIGAVVWFKKRRRCIDEVDGEWRPEWWGLG